jgi:hypothetical protein
VSDPMFPVMPPLKGPEQPKVKPPVPREVNISFAVWVLTSLLSAVLQFIDADSFVANYQKQIAGSAAADTLTSGTLKTAYIIAIVGVGVLMVFFAWKMRSGSNWARIVLGVLGVFGLMFQAQSVGLSDWLTLLGVLITAVGLVFMFVPASNAYFAKFRRPRPPR